METTGSSDCCSISPNGTSLSCQRFGKFDEFTRGLTDFLCKDLPSNPLKVMGCSRKTQGMGIFFHGTYDESGKISTEVKNKYIYPFKSGQNMVSTTGINSEGKLLQQVEIFNVGGAKGVKLEGQTCLSSAGTIESAQCAAGMAMSNFNVSVSGEFLQCPMFVADGVAKFGDVLLGAQANYSFSAKAIQSYSTGLALIRPEYKVALKANEGFKTFTASYYQAITPNLTIGYRATLERKAAAGEKAKDSAPFGMEIALKYMLNSGTFIKGKLDQKGELRLGVSSLVSPGLRFVVGGIIDTKNLNASVHKTGMNIVFEG